MCKNTKNSAMFLDYFKGSVIPTSEESLNVSRKSKPPFHRNICLALRYNFSPLDLDKSGLGKRIFALMGFN